MKRPEKITGQIDARLLQPHLLQCRVHTVAMRQGSLSISVHAQENMKEREVTFRDLYSIFRQGAIERDGRFQTTKRGEEIRFRIDRVIDSRPLAAIAVIAPTEDSPAEDSNVYVITVMEVTTANKEDGNDED